MATAQSLGNSESVEEKVSTNPINLEIATVFPSCIKKKKKTSVQMRCDRLLVVPKIHSAFLPGHRAIQLKTKFPRFP